MIQEPTIHHLFDLDGRVALVTGATGYLGTALSQALAEAGASVVVSSRQQSKAAEFARKLPVAGSARHHGVQLDYTDPSSIERGVADALAAAGRIDILVNNGYELSPGDLTNITPENFTRQLANATGCFLLARLVRDHAVTRRGEADKVTGRRGTAASIIMIGSMYGVVGSYPDAYAGICQASSVAYHTLKGGIIQMTRHLAVYWAEDGVRVNCLSPGPFPNEPKVDPRMVERLCSKSPMRRMGRPDELKGAVVFLASEASSYVTGHNLVVDGGWAAW